MELFKTLTLKAGLFFTISLFFLLNQGCYHKNKEVVPVPDKLIPHDSMVLILTDLQLAEGIVSFERLNRVNKKNLKDTYYQKVLNHYGITAKQFRENMDYYNMQFDEMASIYDEVIQRLTVMEESIKKEKEQSRKRKKEKKRIPPSPEWLVNPPDSLQNTGFWM